MIISILLLDIRKWRHHIVLAVFGLVTAISDRFFKPVRQGIKAVLDRFQRQAPPSFGDSHTKFALRFRLQLFDIINEHGPYVLDGIEIGTSRW